MNVQQLYLDLCTSWQSEPVYKEDVMMILSNLSQYDENNNTKLPLRQPESDK